MNKHEGYREGYVVGSWNVARALSHPRKHTQIAEGIEAINADVLSIVEAYDKSGVAQDPRLARRLGYDIFTTEYEDHDPHPSVNQFISVLVRKELEAEASVVRLGTRNAFEVSLPSGKKHIRAVAGHWDDRNSTLRRGMTKAFISQLKPGEPTVLVGDLNNQHASDRGAQVLQSTLVRGISRLVPESMRIGSLLHRSIEMADGEVLSELQACNFTDADLDHTPTMKFMGVPLMQLDHMMYTQGLVRAVDFRAHDLPGSDHRPISAIVSAV